MRSVPTPERFAAANAGMQRGLAKYIAGLEHRNQGLLTHTSSQYSAGEFLVEEPGHPAGRDREVPVGLRHRALTDGGGRSGSSGAPAAPTKQGGGLRCTRGDTTMEMTFDVDGQTAEFRRNPWTGRSELTVGSDVATLQSPFRFSTHFELSKRKVWKHRVGEHDVEIVRERSRFLGGMRPSDFRVSVDGRVVSEARTT
jgi:hypothetical protein